MLWKVWGYILWSLGSLAMAFILKWAQNYEEDIVHRSQSLQHTVDLDVIFQMTFLILYFVLKLGLA